MEKKVLSKKTEGYGYKYTELADINAYLASANIGYYQYIQTENDIDYIMTVPFIDGKELAPRKGCRVATATLSGKSNPAQEQGSALTYARRYSLLMAFGLATEDDDGASLDKKTSSPKPQYSAKTPVRANDTKISKPEVTAPETITEGQRKAVFAIATKKGWIEGSTITIPGSKKGSFQVSDLDKKSASIFIDTYGDKQPKAEKNGAEKEAEELFNM